MPHVASALRSTCIAAACRMARLPQAENEARYFLDAVEPNCEFKMRWTENGAMYFAVEARHDIRRDAEITMHRVG